MKKKETKTEKKLREQTESICKHLLGYFFNSKPIGGDCYADYCLLCGKEGFGKLEIKHDATCDVGKFLTRH